MEKSPKINLMATYSHQMKKMTKTANSSANIEAEWITKLLNNIFVDNSPVLLCYRSRTKVSFEKLKANVFW